jgi:uncharacterized FlgJ-related protein
MKAKALQLYAILLNYGMSDLHSKFIVSQSAHETKGFTSKVYKENTNLFGMTYAGQSTAKGQKNGYAWYESDEESIVDLLAWLSRHVKMTRIINPVNTMARYVAAIKADNYFTDNETNYLKGCNYYFHNLFE